MTNTVNFKVAGNDVISFIDQVKRKSDDMTSEMIENAKKQAAAAKDQLKIVEDQIRAQERLNRLEAEAARQAAIQNRDVLKQGNQNDYKRQVDEINNSDLSKSKKIQRVNDATVALEIKNKDVDVIYKDQLKAAREQERQSGFQTKLLKDNIDAIKADSLITVTQLKKNNGDMIDVLDANAPLTKHFAEDLGIEKYNSLSTKDKETSDQPKSIFKDLITADNFNKLLGNIETFASSKNGFDLIKPAASIAGQVTGALLGKLVGAGAEGAAIGKAAGDLSGEMLSRKTMTAQDFLRNKYTYEATTQKSLTGISDMSSMGVSAVEYLATLKQIAVQTGTSARASQNANDTLEMSKGLGIAPETIQQIFSLFRNTNKDASNLVGGIMQQGSGSIFKNGDFTYLNEFTNHMMSLTQTMRQNTDEIHTGSSMDIMKRFDSLGGAFQARDGRELGLINQIHGSLINPTSDAGNALSFMALREANPNMGIADLQMEKEKGLSSPTYLKSMLKYVDQLGGDEQFKRMNIAGLFGVNQAAAKRIYEGRDKLMAGEISQADLENKYVGNFQDAAENKTTTIDKNTAVTTNGLLGGWMDTLESMQTSFKSAMESAFQGATITMQNGQIQFPSSIKSNSTSSGKK